MVAFFLFKCKINELVALLFNTETFTPHIRSILERVGNTDPDYLIKDSHPGDLSFVDRSLKIPIIMKSPGCGESTKLSAENCLFDDRSLNGH